ncbi:hypothetical protein ATO13_23266 [Stappia sp. 22II-S9-Z10]|nr:hypothetical protein ATO13_23266 [Stappia sp. 22II-S9-Z10]
MPGQSTARAPTPRTGRETGRTSSRSTTPRSDRRSTAAKRWRRLYATPAWRDLRAAQLSLQPLCEICQAGGRLVPATVVNHRRRHEGDATLFFDPANLQSVCKPCHDGHIQSLERGGPGRTQFTNEGRVVW